MKKFFTAAILSTLMLAPQANAAVITSTLGNNAQFTDGQQLGVADFTSIVDFGTGDNGNDIFQNLSRSWQHSFGAITDTVLSATFKIGVYEHDSASNGDQLGSLSFDGEDNTTALNTMFESSGGASGQYNEYTIALSTAGLADLIDGLFDIEIDFKGSVFSPGFGTNPGVTHDFNGGRIVFSTLDITTQTATNPDPTPVNAPSVLLLLLAGLSFVYTRKVINT